MPTRSIADSYSKNELIIAALSSMVIVFVAWPAVLLYIGMLGKKQSEDEITGGRTLVTTRKSRPHDASPKVASDIIVDDLPIIKDSEIQNFAMHGTVGSGKSTLMRKFLDQCRQRGDMVIIYDKGLHLCRNYYQEGRDIIPTPLDQRCQLGYVGKSARPCPISNRQPPPLIPMGSSETPSGRARPALSLPKVPTACALKKGAAGPTVPAHSPGHHPR